MTNDARDRDLGMNRAITRRDFLNGVAIGIGGLALGSTLSGCGRFGGSDSNPAQDRAGYNPPAGTGMRGDNAGSFEAAHGLRDGTFWQNAGYSHPHRWHLRSHRGGAGISGLAAAHFFRKQAGANARILILEAHDDFGGHAERKQLHAGNRLLLSYGAQSIESPSLYSAEAKGLLADVGCDVQKFYRYYDRNLASSLKLGSGMFFDRETFGEDRLVAGFGKIPHRDFFAKAPLSDAARRDIVRLYTEKVDYLPGLTPEQKKAFLDKISYADFLTKIAKCTPEVVPVFQTRSHDLYGVGIDAISAFALHDEGDDYGYGYPGLDAMLGPSGDRGPHKPDPYIFHFPDGNASVARLLVRSFIPEAIPGHTMEDVVLAQADYSRLDRASSPVRIRLNSTVVGVRHDGDPASASNVEVTYTRDRQMFQVRGRRVRAGLLQQHGSLRLPRTSRQAEGSAGLWRKNAAGVLAHCHSQLDLVPEAGRVSDRGPRMLSPLRRHRLSREHRRIQVPQPARKSRWSCSWCARPASPACRNASSIAWGTWNFTTRRLKLSSARSATNSRAC